MTSEDSFFKMDPLPWDPTSLEPFMSKEMIDNHYDYFYRGYFTKINNLATQYTELQDLTLAEMVDKYTGKIRDTAAQILNHNFFWKNISPDGGNPGSRTYQFINSQFGSYDMFRKEFTQKAVDHFGSGWVWLVYHPIDGILTIIDGDDAYNPIMDGYVPLLTLDVWEHAYYLDYINDKRTYSDNFWDFVNWKYVDRIVEELISKDNYKVYV